jgi:DNA-binding transcriptional LysR family regulator
MQEHWQDIPLLLACVRTRSFTRAAKELGIEVSTASRRVSALEQALGLILFERTRSGLHATDAALALLPAAEEAERALGHLVAVAGGFSAKAEGVVRIATAPGIADGFLVPILNRVRQRHPKLAFDLDADIRTADLGRGEADIALRSIRPTAGELVVRSLLRAPWVAAAAPSLCVLPVEQWSSLSWIGWGADLAGMHVSRWLSRHAPNASIALRTSHFPFQLQAAKLGLGVVMVPVPYLDVHGLQRLPYVDALEASALEWPEDALYLVAHQALRHDPRVAVVWDAIVEGFAGMVDG